MVRLSARRARRVPVPSYGQTPLRAGDGARPPALLCRLPWSTLLRGGAARGPRRARVPPAPPLPGEGEGVTCGGTASAGATSVRRGRRRGLATRGVGVGAGGRRAAFRSVPFRPVPSRPARRPPHLAAAWSASRQSRPLAQDVSHIRISASVGSRARPYHSARGGEPRGRPSSRRPRGSPRPGDRPPPLVAALFRGRRRRAARGAAPGVARGRRGASDSPAGAGGASPVTSSGGYKREEPRGNPAAEAAPAAERRDARRGPDRGTHAAGPPPPQGRSATTASPRTAGLRAPSRHDVPGLRRRVRGALLPLQQRFPGRGQPHLLPLAGGLLLQHGLARQPAGEAPGTPAAPSPRGGSNPGGNGTGWRDGSGRRGARQRPWRRAGRGGLPPGRGPGGGSGPGAGAGAGGGAVAGAALCGGCVKRLH